MVNVEMKETIDRPAMANSNYCTAEILRIAHPGTITNISSLTYTLQFDKMAPLGPEKVDLYFADQCLRRQYLCLGGGGALNLHHCFA